MVVSSELVLDIVLICSNKVVAPGYAWSNNL